MIFLMKHKLLIPALVAVLLSVNFIPALAFTCPERSRGYVNDYANVLGEVDQLESQLENFEQQTSHEAYVVTINNLDGVGIEEYALTLFDKWSIGKEREDNGILLLSSIQDRQVWIEVGYGLESALSSSTADQIISHEVSPAFSQGDYRQGVDNGVAAIIKALNGQYQVEEKIVDDHGKWVYLIVVLVVVFSIILISVVSGRLGQRKISRRKFRK